MKSRKGRRPFHARIGLSLFFSFVVFAILVITAFLMAAIAYFTVQSGAIGELTHQHPLLPMLLLFIVSIIVGTAVSFIISKFPLRPIHKIIDATNQLAEGRFSTRLNMRHPPEVARLAESFNRMAQELGNTELLRSDFINNFSHEFKTPIVSIKGFAEMLKYDDLTNEERNEYLDIVISEATRLASLATNVLNLSKVENQAIISEQDEFNLGEQIRRTIVLLQKNWEGKNQTLSAEIQDINICGNEEMLGQVWLNLLDNAVKFSPEGGRVDVSLHEDQDSAKFIIQNSGDPLSEDAQQHIFEKFYQGDLSHTTAGNGLGLSLVKKIIELHSGSIFCTSNEDGVQFTVSLPLSGQ